MITTCNASYSDNAASSCDSFFNSLRLMCGLICCWRQPSKMGICMTEVTKGGKWRLNYFAILSWETLMYSKPHVSK